MTESYILDWLNLIIRWVHVITGIAWVGASFYFVWLLNRLLPDENSDPELLVSFGHFTPVVSFTSKAKYRAGRAPNSLHWFKWRPMDLGKWIRTRCWCITSVERYLTIRGQRYLRVGLSLSGWV